MIDNTNKFVEADILIPDVRVCTYPQGPRGIGITLIELDGNEICFHMDNGLIHSIPIPGWWFGTKEEYYALSEEEKKQNVLHFIEE